MPVFGSRNAFARLCDTLAKPKWPNVYEQELVQWVAKCTVYSLCDFLAHGIGLEDAPEGAVRLYRPLIRDQVILGLVM